MNLCLCASCKNIISSRKAAQYDGKNGWVPLSVSLRRHSIRVEEQVPGSHPDLGNAYRLWTIMIIFDQLAPVCRDFFVSDTIHCNRNGTRWKYT